MTNAEKIKNMTIEELATMLSKDSLWRQYFHPEYCGIVAEGENPGFCDNDCYECVLEWLEQEAKKKEEKPKQIEICIENEEYYDMFCPYRSSENEGYYDMYCPYGLSGCIHDPGYILQEYPEWYKELYGDMPPEEAAQKECLRYCKDGSDYDDEDK